jgi:hypothetical protein
MGASRDRRAAGRSVRRVAPARALWPAHALSDAGYADAFEVQAPSGDAVAEEWMRRTLEGAPATLRWFVAFGWRFVLGFRPALPPNILGWRVVTATDDWVLLSQGSKLVAASLLLRRTPTGLTWGTRVRFDSRGARPVWGFVGVLHRRIVPYLLGRAAAESARAT